MSACHYEVPRRRRVGVVLLAATALLGGEVTRAEAVLTVRSCLAKKLTEWGKLRNCQAKENAKALQAKPADLAKCQRKFDDKLAMLMQQAGDAGIACRYSDNGDGTVTDYDTGLMWERKDGTVGGLCLFPADAVSHCVNSVFYWDTAQAYVASTSPDDLVILPFLAGHTDWRLPTIAELTGIFDTNAPGCGAGSPCIDPVFGATAPSFYLSSTTRAADPNGAWCVSFRTGQIGPCAKDFLFHVRGVRGNL